MKLKSILSLLIILLFSVLLLTCKKDETVPLNQFSIIEENVNATATTVSFKVYYDYASGKHCSLDHVTLFLGRNSEMTDPQREKCELKEDDKGTFFQLNLGDLAANTTYYYNYEVANAINSMKTEVKSFATVDYGMPSVTTVSVTNVTGSGAVFNGNVTDGGEMSVTERGFCYGTNSGNLTVSGQHVVAGSGLGSFTKNVSGLSSSTTYYMRAYAKNDKGVAYGSVKTFTTPNGLPTVTTNNVTNISSSSANCGGNVTSDGGYSITARGVCWSTSQNPTVSGSHTSNGTGTGSFSSYMSGLSAGTTYYVRAYATNSKGTSYGAQKSFTTSINCPTTVSDYDGNSYNVVKIGNQCWMKQNLRTTHYTDGTSIYLGYGTSTTVAYRYCPNNSSSNVNTYGYLYNWAAVMHGLGSSLYNPSGVQGLCPTGWHVPSDAEWTQLTNYVEGQSQYLCNGNSDYIAKALSSTYGWDSNSFSCTPGYLQSGNNSTGFTALPSGVYQIFADGPAYSSFGSIASFWSCTGGSYGAWTRDIISNASIVYRNDHYKSAAYSVRCVRD